MLFSVQGTCVCTCEGYGFQFVISSRNGDPLWLDLTLDAAVFEVLFLPLLALDIIRLRVVNHDEMTHDL